ncbi:MAG: hypothetical protein CMB80_05890 [Flammeovirgaceae bacterium]|nr:hypothetical protein [Flammeovirgaceae bacterium]
MRKQIDHVLPTFGVVSPPDIYNNIWKEVSAGDLLHFKPKTLGRYMRRNQAFHAFSIVLGHLQYAKDIPYFYKEYNRFIWVITMAIGEAQRSCKPKRFIFERKFPVENRDYSSWKQTEVEVINHYEVLHDLWYNYDYKTPPRNLGVVLGGNELEELWLMLELLGR